MARRVGFFASSSALSVSSGAGGWEIRKEWSQDEIAPLPQYLEPDRLVGHDQ